MGVVEEETLRAIAGADHLTEADSGTVAVLLDLARTIDVEVEPDAPFDNVTIPTYLKYAAELGLTPVSRVRLGVKEKRDDGKLAQLRSVRGGKSA